MERDQRAAAAAVEAAAGEKGWGIGELATQADVDPGTVGDFLGARRWPQLKTRGALERALGWPAGSISRIAEGGQPPIVQPAPPPEPEPFDLAAEANRLTPRQQAAVLAVVRAMLDPGAPEPTDEPDLSQVQGLRLDETDPALRVVKNPDHR